MAPRSVLSASKSPITKTAAPSACRYFGTKRIHNSSPPPMMKVATSRMTRLRLRPKKFATLRSRFTIERLGAGTRHRARRKRQIPARESRDHLDQARRNRKQSNADLRLPNVDRADVNRPPGRFPREEEAPGRKVCISLKWS